MFPAPQVVVDTTKVRFFKQITTQKQEVVQHLPVVVDTTKVRFFKQITTKSAFYYATYKLLLIPQRYDFSSKITSMCEGKYCYIQIEK